MSKSYNDDVQVTVCDECLRASCWHWDFPCARAYEAGLTTRTVKQLKALNLEHPSYYAAERLNKICGEDFEVQS